MKTLTYAVDITAPKQTVWEVMLGQNTYGQWTDAFQPGSYFEGSWDKDSKIRFVTNENGNISGMFGRIADNVPYEFVSIEQLGEIVDGKEAAPSPDMQSWIGSHENYRFTEKDGVTTLGIELTGAEFTPEIVEMFGSMWPPALQKLKAICESTG